MLRVWSSSRDSVDRSADERICLVCAAARRAQRSPDLDPAVALSVSAEVELEGAVPSDYLQAVVSSFVTLSEEEALELLRQVPHEAHDDQAGRCPLAGDCHFGDLLRRQIAGDEPEPSRAPSSPNAVRRLRILPRRDD